MAKVCELCGGDEQIQIATIYGGYIVNFPEGAYPTFYKMDVEACHVCLDGMLSVWDSMKSAVETLKQRGKETTPARFAEVKCAFTYDIPKGRLEDSFRAFMSLTLDRTLRLKDGVCVDDLPPKNSEKDILKVGEEKEK